MNSPFSPFAHVIGGLAVPGDPLGRTVREVNEGVPHAIPLGALVEVASGAKLFVVGHERDFDGTPLYSLSAVPPGHEMALRGDSRFHKSFGEAGLQVIRLPRAGAGRRAHA